MQKVTHDGSHLNVNCNVNWNTFTEKQEKI